MGSVNQISPDEAENSGMEERKQHIQCEHKDVRNVIFKDGQGLSEEDESQNHAVLEDMDNNDTPSFAQQAGLQKQQRQPSGPIVHWDRFLPVGALKVLLVENDDSTRQVVGALLRNCSYEVIAAANGLQAWKILEDMINNIDLVLTEVFMPSLCGITLLSKIMSRKTCMNIPVIMMSSNDSMGTIFKCLSKGAVDFLVKPIRKNELKNLWQHFSRRCHSSSGSGIQTQKSIKTKSADDSDNNSGSDDDDNGSSGLNARDGSDNGSVTQSSCTKRALEVECPQRVPLLDQITDPPDSTCAQVIHPNPETFCNDWVPHPASGECQGQKESTDELMGKDLEIGIPRNAVLNYETTPDVKVCSKLTYESVDKLPGNDQKNEGSPGRECDNVLTSEERSAQAAHLIGEIAKYPDTQTVTPASQAPNGSSKTTECQDKHTEGTTDLPSLELSLKRLRSVGELGSSTHEERNVLRRSEQSAFSRYRKSATSNQAPNGYGGSCSPLDNGSEAMRAESSYNMISSSQAAPLKKGSNGSGNNTGMSFTNNMMSSPDAVPLKQGSAGGSGNSDMGSSTKNVFTKSAPNKEKPASTSAGTFTQTPTFRPVQIRTSTDQQILQQKTNEPLLAGATGQAREIQRQVVEYHHHHYDHHHLHLHNMQQQQQHPPDHDDLPPNNMAVAAPQCWSSNVSVGPVEGNDANFSINGSNSGSMQGSNGHNRGSTAAIPLALNIQGASGIAENRLGGGNASGRSNGSVAVDHIRFAQREAALRKFRQKRKERNFGKKVRYQSRKRLAEQRPRVRGQFVKQTVREQNGQEEEKMTPGNGCSGAKRWGSRQTDILGCSRSIDDSWDEFPCQSIE